MLKQRAPHCLSALGIDEVHALVLPQDKAAIIAQLQCARLAGGDGGRRHQRRALPWPRPTSALPWAAAPTWPCIRPD
ncbi:hypothetical protein LP420_24010 [Massilia sp. B-10]|nr:hypothetical protein LP420_24010 [Massilia sp. B-10]